MPDLENRMPELLHDLARDARPDPDLARRVLRRSRRRRVANVALVGATAVAVVVGGLFAAGAVDTWDRTTPTDDTTPPSEVAPTPVSAIWPETDTRSLAIAQVAADAGALGWRLDPSTTAETYAVQELGWKQTDVVVTRTSSDPESGATTVTIVRSEYADGPSTPPETELALRQLGEMGATGVWSVVGADTGLIVPGERQDGRWPTSAPAGSQLELVGTRIGEAGEWTLVVSTEVFTPADETGMSTVVGNSGPSQLGTQSGPFAETVSIPVDAPGTVIIQVAVADERGTTVALDSFPVAVEAPDGTVSIKIFLPGVIWPEVTQAALDEAQARADAGELDRRLDPVETAAAFATDILGWDAADVVAEETGRPRIGTSLVTVSNLGLGPGLDSATSPAPETLLTLRQLGRVGDGGVWTVASAESDLLQIDRVAPHLPTPGNVYLEGRLGETISEWSIGIWLLNDGERVDVPSVITMADEPSDFTAETPIPAALAVDGTIVGVLVALWDPEGTLVAADAFPYIIGSFAPSPSPPTEGSGGETPPTGATGATSDDGLAVLETVYQIKLSLEIGPDFDGLEALIDPDRFSYNFDDGSNPVPEWRKDPSVLAPLTLILDMPSTTTKGTPDVGTITVWPSLVDADLANPTSEEQAMLDALGYTERDVQDMIDAFGGYVGPRTGIAEDGTWLFYTTGGD